MNIQELYTTLCDKARINSGKLPLAADKAYPESLNRFIARIPEQAPVTVVVGSSGLVLSGDQLAIRGKCEGNNWPLGNLAIPSVALKEIAIVCTQGETEVLVVSAESTASLEAPAIKAIDIKLTYRTDQNENPWYVAMTGSGAEVSPTKMIALSTNIPVPYSLPSSITFWDQFMAADPQKYSVSFYPNTPFDTTTSFLLRSVGLKWEPLPGIFTFNGVDVEGYMIQNGMGILITGHMVIGSIGTDLSLHTSIDPTWVVSVSPTPPAKAFPGLADLATWIGGTELNNAVEQGFDNVGIIPSGFDLAITSVEAHADFYKPEFKALHIHSRLSVGALKLDVKLSLPAITISGKLHENVNVCTLLDSLSLSSAGVPGDLEISTAEFLADLGTSRYSISTQIKNLWKAGPFSFDEVALYLAYDSQGIKGSFGCRFSVSDLVTMALEAQYGIEERGWVFRGGIPAGTTLKIGDIIELLSREFGIEEVPEPVKSLELTEFDLSYSTENNRFTFRCAGHFTVDDVKVEMEVNILVGSSDKETAPAGSVVSSTGWHATFTGQITINKLLFVIRFDTENFTNNTFIAAYHNLSEGSTPLHDLIKGVSEKTAQYIPPRLVIDLKEVKFIFSQQKEQKQFLFGLEFDVVIDLRDIPVIGDKLPENMKISVKDMQLLFTSEAFTAAHCESLNKLLPDKIVPLPKAGLAKGLMITGELNIIGLVIHLDTGNKETTPKPVNYSSRFIGYADLSGTQAVAPSEITWFNVQKQLGPMKFQRIGLAYADNVLSFAFDASLTLGPASLTVTGLSLGSPLDKFRPVFGLQGFSLDINTGGFSLGGGFLKVSEQGYDAYYGTVLVSAGSFGFRALGGHMPAHPNPERPSETIPTCFFIYANVEIPMGGPPYFSLSGLAGGFGINNKLKLPTVDQLGTYILLPGPGSKAPKEGDSPQSTIATVLPQLQAYFIQEPGQYWMAAGIAFSSFEMVTAFALVTASFGVDFQIALIGSCSMTFPKGTSRPVAYVEIVIMASYTQSSGLFAVEGVLSPTSYIFGDFCRLTGGFAFYIWINPPVTEEGPRPGDFLVSLGGYHPEFQAPAYYPKLPRLGLNFSLGPLQVAGQGYFAITPGMFMAGMQLKATWNLEIIKAWFDLGIHFIMNWAPFHYDAIAHVRIGCTVNLGLFTLDASIGADLHLWGPPFGGKASIDLEIITFDIAFGDQSAPAPPLLTWEEFKSGFLPADTSSQNSKAKTAGANTGTNILKASVPAGLSNSSVDSLDWIIDSNDFLIQVQTAIPANELRIAHGKDSFKQVSAAAEAYNNWPPPLVKTEMPYLVFTDTQAQYSGSIVWNPENNIKPMGRNGTHSTLDVSLSRIDHSGSLSIVELTVVPIVENSAAALWDQYDAGRQPKANDATFLPSALMGVKLLPIPRIPGIVNNVALIQLLYQQHNDYWFTYTNREVDPAYEVEPEGSDTPTLAIHVTGSHTEDFINKEYCLSSLESEWITRQRNSMLAELANAGFGLYEEADLHVFSSKTALTDWPEVLKLADSLTEL